jgi:hypothetical protein
MAIGDVAVYDQFKEDVGGKLHDLNTDDMYYCLNSSTLTPTEALSDPRYGTGGGTNLTTTEVSGGNVTAGGSNIAPADAWTRSGATCTFDLNDISITQNGTNPTNARWLNVYNFTDTGKRAPLFLDLGADVDLSAGDFTVTWNASGVFTLA